MLTTSTKSFFLPFFPHILWMGSVQRQMNTFRCTEHSVCVCVRWDSRWAQYLQMSVSVPPTCWRCVSSAGSSCGSGRWYPSTNPTENTIQHNTQSIRDTLTSQVHHTQSYNVVKSNRFPLTKSLLGMSEWWQNICWTIQDGYCSSPWRTVIHLQG